MHRAGAVGSSSWQAPPARSARTPVRRSSPRGATRRRRANRATRGTSSRRPRATGSRAARLRTLPLAVTPILIGTGAAILVADEFHWVIALFCLIVSVSLQIGVNYANDYSDGIRGTDDHRVGPARLTASRKVKPRAVLLGRARLLRDRRGRGPRDHDPHAAVVAARRRRRLHPRRLVLHRRQAPLRLLRPRRALRLRLLRARRDARHHVGAGARAAAGGVVRRRRRGPPRLRGAARQQPARHRPGPQGRQAHADRADRPHRDALALHRVRARGVRHRGASSRCSTRSPG